MSGFFKFMSAIAFLAGVFALLEATLGEAASSDAGGGYAIAGAVFWLTSVIAMKAVT